MVELSCKICGKSFSAGPYRARTAKYCSRACKGVDDSVRFKGNSFGFRNGHSPWNKGLSVHLSPKSEFKKGMVPWNKGISMRLSPATEFKKGLIPKNKLKVGDITQRPDKQGRPRNWVKVAEPNRWMSLYRYRLLSMGHVIPKGYVVHHIDFTSDNDEVENLVVISRREHVQIHNRWNHL